MANLGTLWFGADIDLSALKQKIQSGNQSILDALKINYDPQSYQQMVNKLKGQLANETFNIKLNASNAVGNIRQQLSRNTGLVGGIDALNDKIREQSVAVNNLKARLAELQALYKRVTSDPSFTHYDTSKMRSQIASLKSELIGEQKYLQNMKAQRDAYVNSTKDTILNLRRESLEQRNSARATQQAMAQKRQAVREYNESHMRLNATLAGGIHVSTQLGSALSGLFAVDAARNFLGQVIEIGGQLEKQRISIGAILGDTVKASHLFEQIKSLALQSPFGVVELDQYTKQLSAYGFKYNELFDMTKRLADISAGAGTDIGRLTLALGHVRSATYLTGITLRQFSMNNIPMLKMLADYYSEVEKHAVTTAEVQKRISKRQVSYEDVIEQIRRLTDEGGMFYNMQEKISESLAARFKNLKDAMDIMYGEMAEGTVGDMLKELASVLLKTTRHWREILAVMGVAAGAFMLSKLRIGAQTIAMQGNTAATIKNIMAKKQVAANALIAAQSYRKLTAAEKINISSSNSLTAADLRQAMAAGTLTKEDTLRLIALKKLKIAQAMHLAGINGITAAEIRAASTAGKWRTALAGLQMSLKNAFMGVGAGTWATLALMAGTELYMAYNQWESKIDDKSNEMKDLVKSRIIDLQKIQKTMNDEGRPTESVALKNRVDEMKQVLANSEAYTKTLDEQLGKTTDINKQYEILSGAIGDALEKNRRMLDVQDKVASMIKASTGDFMSTDYGENLDWFFNDDINKNMSQTLDAYKDLRTAIDAAWEYKDAIKNVIEEMVKSGKISEQFAEQMKNAPFEEQLRLLAESGYWDVIVGKITSTDVNFVNFADKLKEASNGVTERWDEIVNDDIPRMMKKKAEDFGGDEKKMREWALNNVDDFKAMLDGINDQLGIQEPEIRRRLKRLFYDYVRFGQLEKGLAEGAKIGASLFGDETLQKILEENEKADITDKTDPAKKEDKGSKKDTQLEAAKTKLQQYKAFLSEYKKYREMYSKEKAISKLGDLFPDLKDEKGSFLGLQLVDNYTEVLDKLRKSLHATTDARKKFLNEIDKTSADTVFDREKESIKKNAEAMDEYTKKMQDQWKLYRSLLSKSGGNREFAQLAFNDNGVLWDDVSKKMLETFNKRGEELGVIPVGFRWDMKEQELKDTLVDANGQVQTELVNLAKKIQDIIKGNYNKFLEDSAEAYNKALSKAEKVIEIERQLSELEKEREQYNGNDKAVIEGYEAQINAKRRELEQAKSDALKESTDYLNFYNAILTLTIPEAEKIGEAIRKNLNLELKSGRLSARQYLTEIKRINEQIEKLQNKRSGLAAMLSGGLNGYISNMKEHGDSKWNRGINDLQAAEKDFEKAVKMYNEASSAGDVKGMEAANAQMTASENAMKSANSMMASGQAMSGAAGKAAGAVAIIDTIIHGINDTVQGIKGAFDEIREMYEALGHDTNSEAWQDWGTFLSSFSSASASATKGWDSLKNGNMGGVIEGVVGSFTGWITGFAKGHDAKRERQIQLAQEQIDAINRMRDSLERSLERAISGIYGLRGNDKVSESFSSDIEAFEEAERLSKSLSEFFGTEIHIGTELSEETINAMRAAQQSRTYYDQSYAMLLKQRDELQAQYAAEEDKKDSDSERLADFQAEIESLQDQITHFAEDMAKALYDIDFKSWASELSDALVDAWAAGESGAEAYKKKVSEILRELGVKMITERFVSKALEPIMDDFLKQYEQDDGVLTKEGMNILGRMYDASSELQKQVNDFMDGINGISREHGVDLKDTSSSSSQSAGIKGITEQTADLISSYVNGIRADVSVIRAEQAVHLPAISVAAQRVSVLAETQVTLQQQIAANTLRNADAADRIYEIMHKIDVGATKVRMA